MSLDNYSDDQIMHELDNRLLDCRNEITQLRAENAALTAECEAAGELIGVMIVPKVKHYNCWYCRVTLTKSEHLPTCEYAVKERAYQQARANRKSKDE